MPVYANFSLTRGVPIWKCAKSWPNRIVGRAKTIARPRCTRGSGGAPRSGERASRRRFSRRQARAGFSFRCNPHVGQCHVLATRDWRDSTSAMTYLRGHTQIRPMHMAMPIGIDVGAIESNTHSWSVRAIHRRSRHRMQYCVMPERVVRTPSIGAGTQKKPGMAPTVARRLRANRRGRVQGPIDTP